MNTRFLCPGAYGLWIGNGYYGKYGKYNSSLSLQDNLIWNRLRIVLLIISLKLWLIGKWKNCHLLCDVWKLICFVIISFLFLGPQHFSLWVSYFSRLFSFYSFLVRSEYHQKKLLLNWYVHTIGWCSKLARPCLNLPNWHIWQCRTKSNVAFRSPTCSITLPKGELP